MPESSAEERANCMETPTIRDNGVVRSRVGRLRRPMSSPAVPSPRSTPRLRFVTPENARFHPDLKSLVDIFQEIRRAKRDNVVHAFTTVARPGHLVSTMKRSAHHESRRMAKLLHRVTKPAENVAQRKHNYRALKAFLQRVETELSILDPTRSRPIVSTIIDADDDMDEDEIDNWDTKTDENAENVDSIAVDAAVSPIPLKVDHHAQRDAEWQIKHDQLEAQKRHLARISRFFVHQACNFRNQIDSFVARLDALSQDDARVIRNRNCISLSLSPSLLYRHEHASIISLQTSLASYTSHASQGSLAAHQNGLSTQHHSDDDELETEATAADG